MGYLQASLRVFLLLLSADCHVHHIISSESELCPADFCLTLSEFASNTSGYLYVNTTLIFQSGHHILGLAFKISSIQSLQLMKLALVQTPTIQCEHSAGFSFFRIGAVYIKEIKFVNCSINVKFVQTFSVLNTSFVGQDNSSSALQLDYTWAVIKRTSFVSYKKERSEQSVIWSPIPNYKFWSKLSYSGGSLIVMHSTITILNSMFEDNSAEVGGAAFFEFSTVIIVESTFKRNSAEIGGAMTFHYSAVRIENSIFTENYMVSKRNNSSCRGGALYFYTLNTYEINVHNCSFINNTEAQRAMHTMYPSGGGAISVIGDLSSAIIFINPSQPWMAITLSLCNFSHNQAERGGALLAIGVAVLKVIKSNFTNNKDGAIFSMPKGNGYTFNVSGCRFSDNEGGQFGGGIIVVMEGRNHSTFIHNSTFYSNKADKYGGAVYVSAEGFLFAVAIEECSFSNNVAGTFGGAVSVIGYPLMKYIIFNKCHFFGNTAMDSGGAVHTITITKNARNFVILSSFENNYAPKGGAVYAGIITLVIRGSNFTANVADTGVIHCVQSSIEVKGKVLYSLNKGSLFLFGSTLKFTQGSHFWGEYNYSPTLNNGIRSFQEGGVVTVFQSNIYVQPKSNSTFLYNTAGNGGALHAVQSNIFVHGHLHTMSNSATNSGGSIYLYQSQLTCEHQSFLTVLLNKANKTGGGIHATNSVIKMHFTEYDSSELGPKLTYDGSYAGFGANTAVLGGGLYLEVNSKFYSLIYNFVGNKIPYYTVQFRHNSALYGGAVYIADETNNSTCASLSYMVYSTLTECSFQLLVLPGRSNGTNKLNYVIMEFKDNTAVCSGSDIFGGLLDRCTISPFDVVYSKNKSQPIDGFTHIKLISTINNQSTIASHAVKIYFCGDDKPNYGVNSISIKVKKGERFVVPVVAVDHVNHTINTTIHSRLSVKVGGLDEDQSIQDVNDSCTNLMFNVFSPQPSARLILYAQGPCKDSEQSQAQINVLFLSCTCPIGFEPNEVTKCNCVCDSRLLHIITECHEENKTLVREGTFWITNTSVNTSMSNSSSGYDYVIHQYCPLNYCHPSSAKVFINFNNKHGADAQCNFNRSGTLCGKCQPGLSLSLGSSRCIKCPKNWRFILFAILVASLVGGIALVALILVLNLTVAVGTLNGIIFYTNIIHANFSSLFPFSAPNIITVILANINLELGIDACFFEGMDTYWKTLLQLAFPAYVILLVVIVIVISEHSTRFARLIGRKNPVASLTTLILLSYTKLIRTIITSLSFCILHYPGGSREIVWLPDGTVPYWRGKHILLFLLAIAILLTGMAYTVLLLLWQWLPQNRFFKWVTYHRFYLFLEPYHAPYAFKYRYWTGLLLLVRVVLYMASALNASGAPGIDLLVTGIVMICLLLFKGYVGIHGRVYKKWPIDAIETLCYVNILILSFVSLYTLEAKQNQAAAAYISGTVTLFILLLIVIYHIFTEICCDNPKLLNKFRQTKWRSIITGNHEDSTCTADYYRLNSQSLRDDQSKSAATVSWVDAPLH